MNEVFDSTTHRATKRYGCFYCGWVIEKGELHGKRAGVSYGDFWTMRYHPECDHQACVVEKWDIEDWEGFDQGSMKRPMTAFDPCI